MRDCEFDVIGICVICDCDVLGPLLGEFYVIGIMCVVM